MKSFLIDGPMITTLERRKATLEQMAKVLTSSDEGLQSDRDAVRILLAKGHHYIDVALCAGEARMLAYQEIVAREMSEP